ncbi:hypothetical protein T07_15190 [Trichinella nelsoni]|uniref:Uncharacterized protein n=1 Tax=Trichinella nelsoni TaxID=6336 RepID=A0A0V0SBQ7_9BILA|nr:hypothetical protein T07_15190 [Trichinella nelsoni]
MGDHRSGRGDHRPGRGDHRRVFQQRERRRGAVYRFACCCWRWVVGHWNTRVTAVFQRSGCDTATHPTTPALVVVVGGLLASTTGAPRAGVVIVQPRSDMRLGFVGSSGLVAIDDWLLVSLGGAVENVCIPASVASASATVASTTMPHFVEIILATAIHRSQMLLELIKPLMTIN